MYAVIESGGKQYRVTKGDIIEVELVEASGPKSQSVTFDRVLFVGGGKETKVGDPLVAGAKVSGELMKQVRGPKIKVFKKKRRKGYKRLRGHRQDLSQILIKSIKA